MVKDDEGWQEVADEFPTRIQFNEIGDELIGTFVRVENGESNGKSFPIWIFKDCTVNGDKLDESCSVGATSRLRAAMRKVRPGKQVRIRYIADIETNQDSPMKDFSVAVR